MNLAIEDTRTVADLPPIYLPYLTEDDKAVFTLPRSSRSACRYRCGEWALEGTTVCPFHKVFYRLRKRSGLTAGVERYTKTCPCGREFDTLLNNQKFCDDFCKRVITRDCDSHQITPEQRREAMAARGCVCELCASPYRNWEEGFLEYPLIRPLAFGKTSPFSDPFLILCKQCDHAISGVRRITHRARSVTIADITTVLTSLPPMEEDLTILAMAKKGDAVAKRVITQSFFLKKDAGMLGGKKSQPRTTGRGKKSH